MDEPSVVDAVHDLRDRLIALLESLSALRLLTSVSEARVSEAELLARALRILLHNQAFERCSVFVLHAGTLRCAAGMAFHEQGDVDGYQVRPSTHEFRLGEGLVGSAAKARALLYSDDCAADPRFKRFAADPRAASGALLSCPVTAGRELLGVLNVYHPRIGFFAGWHTHILTIFAQVLGQLLGYYRLRLSLDKQVQERTEQLNAALLEAQQLRVRYEQLSIVDDLTGLHNRRFFFPEVSTELSRAARNHEPFGLMLMDVDHFKHINDTYGHAAGDAVLADLAACLREQTRDGDILARFGGEEFILALPTTEVKGVQQLANRIREAIADLSWDFNGAPVTISVSIGIAYLSVIDQIERRALHGETILDELLIQADAALYQCKEAGRNQMRFFQEPDL